MVILSEPVETGKRVIRNYERRNKIVTVGTVKRIVPANPIRAVYGKTKAEVMWDKPVRRQPAKNDLGLNVSMVPIDSLLVVGHEEEDSSWN